MGTYPSICSISYNNSQYDENKKKTKGGEKNATKRRTINYVHLATYLLYVPEYINGNGQIINVEAEIAVRVDFDPNIDSTIGRGNVEQSVCSTSENLSCFWSSRGSFAYRNEYCSLGSNEACIKLQDPAPVLISPVPTPGSNYLGRWWQLQRRIFLLEKRRSWREVFRKLR
jgi:hypothetical protein